MKETISILLTSLLMKLIPFWFIVLQGLGLLSDSIKWTVYREMKCQSRNWCNQGSKSQTSVSTSISYLHEFSSSWRLLWRIMMSHFSPAEIHFRRRQRMPLPGDYQFWYYERVSTRWNPVTSVTFITADKGMILVTEWKYSTPKWVFWCMSFLVSQNVKSRILLKFSHF